MIMKDPYGFKSLKLVNNAQTIGAINRYLVTEYPYIKERELVKLKPFSDHHTVLNPVFLYGISDVEKDIPSFSHPVINLEHKWIAMDLRNYVAKSEDGSGVTIRNESEFHLAVYRLILSGMWFTGKQSAIYALKLGHFAFASWLSDNLGRKFGLDMGDILKLKILAMIYYAKLFTDDWTEDDFNKLVIRCKDDVLLPKSLEEVYEKTGALNNIDDFCVACYNVTGNIRLKGLDYTILSNIILNNWLGSNSKEMVNLSLEHPPTWLALVHASLTQRSFKRCFIATVVDKLDKRGKGEEFLLALVTATKEYKLEE